MITFYEQQNLFPTKDNAMREQVKVKTKDSIGGPKLALFWYDIPNSLQEAMNIGTITPGEGAKYTPEQVYEEFKAGFKVTLQAPARKYLSNLEDGHDEQWYSERVQQYMDSWKLGQKSERVRRTEQDIVAQLAAELPSMSDDRKRMIAQMFGIVLPEGNDGDAVPAEGNGEIQYDEEGNVIEETEEVSAGSGEESGDEAPHGRRGRGRRYE